jgi:hypothetical protein
MAFPGTHNISYYHGDTFEFTVTPKASDGSAFSLSGYSSKFFIANKRGSGAIQYECTSSIANGVITCTILPSRGRDLTPGTTYFYDVQIAKSNDSVVHTLLTGTVTVTADITGAA